jgi:peptidoglycan/LPS O-acetylase OafA/YrhL
MSIAAAIPEPRPTSERQPRHFPLSYRAEIDGLRGLSVLAVVTYHAAPDLLPAGFLGVDIFFVISGFLITSLLWREAGEGKISLLGFYARRIRRIVPALLAMLAAACVAASVLLLPSDLMGFAQSAIAAIAMCSNLWFWRHIDYFFSGAAEKPLIHTWSLGVEEQFYLLYPLLLAFLARRESLAILALGLVTASSLALNLYALRVGGDLPAFYLLPTRAWELGAGAMLAVAGARMPIGLGWAGLALIGVGVEGFGVDWLPAGLSVVAGTLVVLASRGPALLAARLSVWLGLISYSLYLWHWPILALARYRAIEPLSPPASAFCVALAFVVATCSYRWIELPFRRRTAPFPIVAIACSIAAAAILFTCLSLIATGGLSYRFDARVTRWDAVGGTHFRCPITAYTMIDGVRACRLAGEPGRASIVLLGNSHAQMYAPAVARIATAQHRAAISITFNGCLPVLGPNISAACRYIAETSIDAAARSTAAVVLIGLTWDGDLSGLDPAITRLRHAGKSVILIGPIAYPGYEIASIEARHLAFAEPVGPLSTSQREFDRRYGISIARYAARSDITFVRPDLVQCANGSCTFVASGDMLFSDGIHLSSPGVALFEPILRNALRFRQTGQAPLGR